MTPRAGSDSRHRATDQRARRRTLDETYRRSALNLTTPFQHLRSAHQQLVWALRRLRCATAPARTGTLLRLFGRQQQVRDQNK